MTRSTSPTAAASATAWARPVSSRGLSARPCIRPDAFAAPVNPTTRDKFEPSAALRAALLDGYASDLAQLPDLCPELDLSLWPSARELGLA